VRTTFVGEGVRIGAVFGAPPVELPDEFGSAELPAGASPGLLVGRELGRPPGPTFSGVAVPGTPDVRWPGSELDGSLFEAPNAIGALHFLHGTVPFRFRSTRATSSPMMKSVEHDLQRTSMSFCDVTPAAPYRVMAFRLTTECRPADDDLATHLYNYRGVRRSATASSLSCYSARPSGRLRVREPWTTGELSYPRRRPANWRAPGRDRQYFVVVNRLTSIANRRNRRKCREK